MRADCKDRELLRNLDNMEINLVKPSDLREIQGWYLARGINPPPHENYPKNGFIINGVAALFVYLTDSSLALIEGFIVNPFCTRRQSSDALNLLNERACVFVRSIKRVPVVLAKKSGVRKRLSKLDYRSIGMYELFIGG